MFVVGVPPIFLSVTFLSVVVFVVFLFVSVVVFVIFLYVFDSVAIFDSDSRIFGVRLLVN